MVKPLQNVIFWEGRLPTFFFRKYVPLVVRKLHTKFQEVSLPKTEFHTIACSAPSALKGTHHNFVVHAPMIMKLGTDMELDVLYIMVAKHFVTMLLLSNYDA